VKILQRENKRILVADLIERKINESQPVRRARICFESAVKVIGLMDFSQNSFDGILVR